MWGQEGRPSHLEVREDHVESDRYGEVSWGDMRGECHRCWNSVGQGPGARRR